VVGDDNVAVPETRVNRICDAARHAFINIQTG